MCKCCKEKICSFYSKIKKIKLYPFILFLLSLLSLALYELYDKDNMVFSLLHEIGISLFILASVTVLLELTDFRDYFTEKLTEIIIEDQYISTLDRTKLKKLENSIQKALYFKEHPNKENSFFYKIQKSVRPLIDGCYYNDYEIRVECFIEDDKIKKRITKRIDIINPKKKEVQEQIPINSFMQNIGGLNKESLYQLESFKETHYKNETKDLEIDRTNDLKLIYEEVDPRSNTRYDLKVYCNDTITINDRCIFEIIYNTITPLSDPHFLNRALKPCKQYRCVFLFKNDLYHLAGYGFGFMDKNEFIKNPFSSGMEICFKDWILPGDGVIFTILKN